MIITNNNYQITSSYILSPCVLVIQKYYCDIVLYILSLPILSYYPIFCHPISCEIDIDTSLKLCFCNLNLPLSTLFYWDTSSLSKFLLMQICLIVKLFSNLYQNISSRFFFCVAYYKSNWSIDQLVSIMWLYIDISDWFFIYMINDCFFISLLID